MATNPMSPFMAQIIITLKAAVVDPQGLAIRDALHQLHFAGVSQVRMGKYLEVQVTASDEAAATAQVAAMCATLLANPVIETYRFTVVEQHAVNA